MAKGNKERLAIFGFGAVALIATGTFALSIKTFPYRLKAPFGLVTPKDIQSVSFESRIGDAAVIADTKDTDRDGLTDAQELKIYGTSPFIPDTDSDGVGDREEIERGSDPNCPEGKDCRSLFAAFPSAREIEQENLQRSLYESTVLSALQKSGLPGISDAATVRTMLRQAGLTKEVVDQFSDAELVELFKRAGENPSPPPQSSPIKGEEESGALPQNPSAEDIRRLLIKGGLEKSVVDQLSDAQLTDLYQQTLREFEGRKKEE